MFIREKVLFVTLSKSLLDQVFLNFFFLEKVIYIDGAPQKIYLVKIQ